MKIQDLNRVCVNHSRILLASIISYMETTKWKPSEEEREVMEAVWMQIKSVCEKLREETNAQNEHIRKMFQEMSDRYYV